jgi:membrane protein DedA with SNARE-associated domain
LVISAISRVIGFNLDATLTAASRETRTFHKVKVFCLIAGLVLAWGAGVCARSFGLILARDHPLVLLALEGRTRNIFLVADKAVAVQLVLIAAASRFCEHFLYYLLGRWAGEPALQRLHQRAGRTARLVRRGEQMFARGGNLAVLVMSNRPVCVLAGAAMMSPVRFIALHLPGTVVRVWIAVHFARASSSFVKPWVLRLEGHAATITIATAAVTVVSIIALAYAGSRRAQGSKKDVLEVSE